MKSAINPKGFALLTLQSPKTVKGEAKGYVTGILYLAPHTLSGHNVCPMASKGCIAACLNTAGRGAFSTVQAARIRRTKWFFSDRKGVVAALIADIELLEKRAAKAGFKVALRLNGTSDIFWHKVAPEIFARFPHIQFYEYTKQGLNKFADKPANLHITFSRAEDNEARALEMLRAGFNVAVVFKKDLPATWNGYTVNNADETDLRFLDPQGVAGLVPDPNLPTRGFSSPK